MIASVPGLCQLECDRQSEIFFRQKQTVYDSNMLALFMFELVSKNYQFLPNFSFTKTGLWSYSGPL